MKEIQMRVFLLLLVSMSFVIHAESESEFTEKVQQLDWKQGSGRFDIPSGEAVVTISDNEFLLLGNDAKTFMHIIEGHDGFQPNAVKLKIHEDSSESTAIYQRYEIGFVQTDDWEEYVDADEMLEEIIQGTEETNKIREKGHASLYVDGWAEPPFLDRENSIIYWAIHGHTSESVQFINVKALKLGRKGYTEIIWTGSPQQFTGAKTVLEPILANYEYNDGFQYDDFMPETDAVAAMGAGALVYKLATGKTAIKAGFLAAAALFAKKFWFVLLLPFAYAWKWVKKRYFSKGE